MIELLLLFIIILFIYLYKKQENFINNKCDVYLISNKSDIKNQYINKINKIKIKSNDKVVRFNHSGNPNIFPHKTDIAVFRNNKYNYWGNGKPIWKNLNNKEVFLLGTNKNTQNVKEELESKNNRVEIINYDKIYNKTESSGKIVINHLLNKNDIDKIYLVGFDFYKGVNNWHNFKNEETFVNNHKNKIIQL